MPLPQASAPAVVPPPLIPAISGGKLLQVFGVSFGVAVIVGNTILIGILRTPGDVAERLPSTALFLGVWIVGGLYALLAGSLVTDWGNSWKSLLLLALSYPAYRLIVAARDRSGASAR